MGWETGVLDWQPIAHDRAILAASYLNAESLYLLDLLRKEGVRYTNSHFVISGFDQLTPCPRPFLANEFS